MKALVVGGSGLLGGALRRALEQAGIAVATTRFSQARGAEAVLDVRDEQAVAQCLARTQPDVVFVAVNNAGGVEFCETHPEDAFALHVQGTRHLARAAAACGALVVYYSTDYVFDGTAGPYSEDAAPNPLNCYGRAKWEAERLLQELAPDHLIIRTTAVFGWERTSRNLAMQVWERLQAGGTMTVPQDQLCNPTLADYLAESSVRLVQRGARGVVHVVGRDRLGRADMAKALARAMGLEPAGIVPVLTAASGQRAPRPLAAGLRTDRLTRLLGTEPLDLDESLRRFRRQWRADTHVRYAPGALPTDAQRLKQEILERVRAYHALVHRPRPFAPYETRVPYAGRVFGADEMANLADSALDFWLTLGPYGELFERKMKRWFGAKDFVVVNSGSTANLAAVLTLMSKQLDDPLRPGDEIITPAVTFPTTVAPLVHSGLVPVFVDCEIGTYNVDPRRLEDALSPKTRGIMIPHTLGNPCDMDAVCDIVARKRLYLIEDSCDALGATFRGRPVGTFGDLGTLSFFPAHHITLGEGGGVIVNRPGLARIVRSVRDWGRDCWCAPGESNTCGSRFGWCLGGLPQGYDHKYTYSNLGYNFKPTDLQAAVGVAQADRIAEFVDRRRVNFRRLYAGLAEFQEYLILPTQDARADPSWFAFPITVTGGVSRHALVQWLENAKIETREVFGGNILKQPAYMDVPHRVCGSLDNTDRVMRDTFFIGVYPGLTDEMIDFVLAVFRRFFEHAGAASGGEIGVRAAP